MKRLIALTWKELLQLKRDPISMKLIVGIPFWVAMSRRMDKKPTFMIGVAIFSVFIVAGPVLKLAGFWPERTNELLYMGLLGGFGR